MYKMHFMMSEKDRIEGFVRIRHKQKLWFAYACIVLVMIIVIFRMAVVMVFQSEYYRIKSEELHERERKIKAARGRIIDTNGIVLASNTEVCTISVIHSQITDTDEVAEQLSKCLSIDKEDIRKKVEKNTAIEKIKTNVDIETGKMIENLGLSGVKVDVDYKRVYPYETFASKVIGFTGSDNQGIVGLEAKYDSYLSGENGLILTLTDAWGMELKDGVEKRVEPINGDDLYISIDYNIQSYAQQLAEKTLLNKEALGVSIIVMNPQNGEILAMVNAPEYDLNNPYNLSKTGIIIGEEEVSSNSQDMNALNNMWRNFCINDTYEPGSIFKTVTATAALETGVVTLNDHYTCRGFTTVSDRRIRCHKTAGHGTLSFPETVMQSCNPAFIEWGRRVGVENMYTYMGKLGLLSKTGVDLAGEATTIIHKQENVKEVELATMSFGQSFQITPLQMLRAVSAIVNGGYLVTPHFALKTVSPDGVTVNEFSYSTSERVIDEKTSDTMKDILRQVVEEGGGSKAYIEGFSIGGKTATSEKLPRGSGKYISSFIGFAPVDNPSIIAMCLINEPQGTYYGGTIAAPVIKELFENVLPYLEISGD